MAGGLVVFMVLGLLPGVGVVFVAMGWLWSALCVALDALTFARAGYGGHPQTVRGICRLSWRSEPWRASGCHPWPYRDRRRRLETGGALKSKPKISARYVQQCRAGVVDPLIRRSEWEETQRQRSQGRRRRCSMCGYRGSARRHLSARCGAL